MDTPIQPKKEWEITPEAFERFLAWIDPNRDQAGKKYEDIRRKLIKIFTCRGCNCPEELGDETINRVIRKVREIEETYVGDPALYFYGVAHRVHHEFLRRKPACRPPLQSEEQQRSDAEYECLEQCMEGLPRRSRDLVLQYYQEDRREKIELRRQLALQLGIPLSALRIRACRIRMNLHACVLECLQKRAA
ncbi:MAG: hypothetical protein JXA73_20170 [Acidobacteria bacterium]|nr:hypothetical protein [Acidobacteriota bacterium]